MQYRRAFVSGASYFFTLVTERRRPILASASAVEVLRNAFRAVRNTRPFEVDAIVVVPDHLHCIWTLPPGDADFSTRWRLIKTRFTQQCDPHYWVKPTPPVWQNVSKPCGNIVIGNTCYVMKPITPATSNTSITTR